ncbi:MAG: hypothetical protein HQK89_05160 [Nitrospirae bacterium]|nr:hypothetical protein [Nitrospirota bacterium]
MSKLLIGVFLSVFVGALLVEVLQRQEPEMMGKIKSKLREKFDALVEPKLAEPEMETESQV